MLQPRVSYLARKRHSPVQDDDDDEREYKRQRVGSDLDTTPYSGAVTLDPYYLLLSVQTALAIPVVTSKQLEECRGHMPQIPKGKLEVRRIHVYSNGTLVKTHVLCLAVQNHHNPLEFYLFLSEWNCNQGLDWIPCRYIYAPPPEVPMGDAVACFEVSSKMMTMPGNGGKKCDIRVVLQWLMSHTLKEVLQMNATLQLDTSSTSTTTTTTTTCSSTSQICEDSSC